MVLMNLSPFRHHRRVFAKAGYRVALIARGADKLKKVADDVAAAASGAEVRDELPEMRYAY